MHAIIDLNGKQHRVEPGKYITVDLMPCEPDEAVELSNVLMVIDGDKTQVGAPFVSGALVKAKVLSHHLGKKILVYKMRRKKGYRLKNGHRQEFTRLQIEDVVLSK
jgi:large subunit ribosomal protein L21